MSCRQPSLLAQLVAFRADFVRRARQKAGLGRFVDVVTGSAIAPLKDLVPVGSLKILLDLVMTIEADIDLGPSEQRPIGRGVAAVAVRAFGVPDRFVGVFRGFHPGMTSETQIVGGARFQAAGMAFGALSVQNGDMDGAEEHVIPG